MADIIQLRRDTASAWTSANPTLASGELGLETDTLKLKVGTGSLAWNSLSYYTLATVGYAPLASPTFTGAVNASGTLQLAGTTITATAAELNKLDGVTADTAELNKLDGVTATTAELNILDGVTATAAELNKLDDVTATTAELNILDGVTATTAELNILDALSRGSILYGNASGATTVLTKGTTDQLLKSDGTDIAWGDAVGGAAIEATATGAITAGRACKINSDGTVSQISSTALGYDELIYREMMIQHEDDRAGFHLGATSRRSPGHPSIAFDKKRNQFVAIMWDSQKNNFMQIVGLPIDGRIYWQTIKDILTDDNPGSGVQPAAGTVAWYDEDFDRIVFVSGIPEYGMATGTPNRVGGHYDYNWAPILRNFGALTEFRQLYGQAEFFNGRGIFLTKRGSQGRLNLACVKLTDGDFRSTYGTISGQYGPEATVNETDVYNDNNHGWTDQEIAIDRTNAECLCIFHNGNLNAEWQMKLMDVSGTGNPTATYTGPATGSSTAGLYDRARVINIGDRQYFMVYTDKAVTEDVKCRVITFSSGGSPTPTFNTVATLDTNHDGEPCHIIQIKDGRIWVRWDRAGALCTVSNNTITVGTVVTEYDTENTTIYGGNDYAGDAVYSPASDVAVICNKSFKGHTFGFSSTTASQDDYIGIAQSTVANAATVIIDVAGGVNAQQSSLTIGKKYYVHCDGTLGTDHSDVYAGMSTSATKLLVKG